MKKEKTPKEKKELTPEQKVKQNRLFKIIYVSIVGGCGVLAMLFFNVAQYVKAKLDSSDVQLMASRSVLSSIGVSFNETGEIVKNKEDALNDQTSVYHDKAIYYGATYNHYMKVSRKHLGEYTGFSITAYTLSILTLVSFGLVLKHSDARKEKED